MPTMRKLFHTIFLLMVSGIFINLECWNIPLSDVIHEEMESVNATCKGKDSCESRRTKDSLEEYNCDCGISCSLFNTCCVDSKHRHRYAKSLQDVKCFQYTDLEYRKYSVPIISQCDPNLENDKTTEELCQSYANDNPILQIPVTDPITGITYKNKYCFACNEKYSEVEPVPWNLVLESESGKVVGPSFSNLYYDKTVQRWFMEGGDMDVSVYFSTFPPEELKTVLPSCFNYKIVSDCASDWTDDNVRKRCRSYMALVRIPRIEGSYNYTEYYRNPHCAICNHQSLENMMCEDRDYNIGVPLLGTFVRLYRIPEKKCEDDMTHDPQAKKCRKIHHFDEN